MASNRRSFLVSAIYGAAGLIVAGLSIPAAGYLLLPPKRGRGSEWADAGEISGLVAGAPRRVEFRRTRVDGWKVSSEPDSAWIVQQPDGKIAAFAPQCTHLGCAYHWAAERKQFVCPCHGSHFAADGRVLAGPAPRPLDRYRIQFEGARLWLGPVETPGRV